MAAERGVIVNQVTAINVFVEIGGKQHIAILDHRMAQTFLGTLGACQSGHPNGARLTILPDEVSEHLLATRRALVDCISTRQQIQPSKIM